ncbi:MGH1-like glycoside hydrolase domain-containing protein [Diplocloster modestus]|uniref:Mannosylglycerate hydrolase MGH1-like glycoside hydrolase domain-containing protein n=1 Tax=Diplocloster modestus TaxID=2850322 RepID=A0ABS6K901_9FIRM|nr:trehalase family glycosidase [Diplocloster modestus]MBU9726989.1 hypothetical protein [Diplocloster modestus]
MEQMMKQTMEQMERTRMEKIASGLTEKERIRIEKLMENGLAVNKETGLAYYTGYANTTLYDWDQYFEGIVQLYMGQDTVRMRNAVLVYLAFQQEDGFTKRAIQNGYSGEEDFEMVKPFLSQITLLCLRHDGHLDWLEEENYRKLQRSLDYWLYARDPDKNNLSYWRSSVETGMDDQHERAGVWRSDYCEGVDLNCHLYRECLALAQICTFRGDTKRAEKYQRIAKTRKTAVLSMWDEEDSYFYDRDMRSGEAIRVKSISGLLPLWAGIADHEQAGRLVEQHILNTEEFWRPYPLPALAASEPGYSPVHLDGDIGCNWRADTWVPTNYMVMHGLMAYGYPDIALTIAVKTRELIDKSGDREYYITETGEGTGLNPFWGWSLLGYFMAEECRSGYNPMEIYYDHFIVI